MDRSSRSRLVLLTCVWKRPELTRLTLRTYQRTRRLLAENLDLCLLAVGSEGSASRTLCEEHGFHYVEYANSPLSHKWNAGVQAARAYDPEGLIIAGSDDLLSPGMFRTYTDKLRDGLNFFGVSDLYFYDALSGRLGYWSGHGRTSIERAGEPIGCGRCFGRALLERTDWNLWPHEPEYERLLDEAAIRFVGAKGFTPVSWTLRDIDARAVDIKVGPNITAFDSIDYEEQWTGNRATDYLREWLSDDELDELVAMPQRAALS